MRIAFVAPYQGPELIRRRPSTTNLALAGNAKIELVAELLRRYGHQVVILSQGEVVENGLCYYRAFDEPQPFDPEIPVRYASALPVRFVNGLWQSTRLLSMLNAEHRARPFDAMLIYNLKRPQMACALHAMDDLRIPVVLEYEDDNFVDKVGASVSSFRVSWQLERARAVLRRVSGGIGVSPHIMASFPEGIPKMLLRGVVSEDVLNAARAGDTAKRNIIAFSGTLTDSKGIVQLIEAWKRKPVVDWELHIAGDGPLGAVVRKMSLGVPGLVLRGLLNRQQNAAFLAEARIGVNPHALSSMPGNLFAFKIIEYLAARAHVITTPMGPLEGEFERGITYMPNNNPETISRTLHETVAQRAFERLAADAAEGAYGPAAVSRNLDALLRQVVGTRSGDLIAAVAS